MKIITILIIFICQINLNLTENNRKIILPKETHYDWKPAHLDKITCPKPELDWTGEYKPVVVLNVLRPPNHKIGGINGFLCHKVEWITRCEYTWYLSKTVSRRIKEETPTEAECKEAIELHKGGRETSGSFPPEECYWNSVNDESDIKVSVTEHKIGYDPYRNIGLDDILIGGYCKDRKCLTTHSSVIWIRDGDMNPCGEMTLETLTVYTTLYNYNTKKWVGSSTIKLSSLEKACTIKFCGVDGIMLSNGIWFHHNQGTDNRHLDVKEKCPENAEIGVLQPGYEIKWLDYKLIDLQREFLCLQALDKIRLQKVVTLHDLQFLRPHKAGPGAVFRVRNKTLETTHANYVEASMVDENELSRDCLAKYLNEQKKPTCIKWDNWIDLGSNKHQGLNGILEIKGSIKFPEDQLLEAEWEAEMFEYFKLDKIHHPFLQNISDMIHDDTDEDLIHDKTVNPGDAINDWITVAENKIGMFFKGIGNDLIKLFYIALIVILIIVLVKICLICKKCCKTRRKRTRNQDELIEFDSRENRNRSVFG
ncbi:glycoprotein [Taiyi bat virus]|uniref:Glycoprotein n=1 Tax=Taiyi bat virus TaxID=2716753 RepID=A0AAE6XNK3_9RHAB|nr:glycoprotein [Taiyi bat virus]QIQ19243.1 glycoprotein [Taiyi bat virus]